MNLVLQGIITVILWVGLWGIIEMLIDGIAGDNRRVRFVSYFALVILGIFLFWIAGAI